MASSIVLPPSQKIFIAGISGSGKSTAAWRWWLSQYPRRILMDYTGEWEQYSDASTDDVQQLSEALRRFARRGQWTISYYGELGPLVNYLLPLPDLERSPIRAVGGAALLADEVDIIAPPRDLSPPVRTLYRRGRHVGLTILSLTQRPEAVSREVSSQSNQALILQLADRRAYEYCEGLGHVELYQRLTAWTSKYPHGGVWWDLRTREERWLTASDKSGKWLVAPKDLPVAPEKNHPQSQEPQERAPASPPEQQPQQQRTGQPRAQPSSGASASASAEERAPVQSNEKKRAPASPPERNQE